ncbi:disease resistance protein RGA2-like [Quercus lobata]|uniref:disease resistance protein RGA2-like n=1 Tax=Quercus lobata TaxID=97700 RepID=UPI00124422EF|nr:disease resistance protein RGA2-like [Quercus lobata]
MADAILYGVVQTIIESLGSSTLLPIGSIWGVKDELEQMKNTVLTIQAVLKDAEEQQVENHQVKHWLMNLRDAVYDADDLLSEFTTHVLQQKVMDGDKIVKKVRILFSGSNPLVFGFQMACKIKAMRERLNDIAYNRNNFQLKSVHNPLETRVVIRGRDQTHSFVLEEEVIGREGDKEAIITLLGLEVEDNVSFISIVGIGGLGKTTLAQYVYNDEKVKKYFELKMWVCVSDVFDLKIIVEKIIASATDEKPENLEMDQLQNKLRKNLNQKKYLLVLDDVWNEDNGSWCDLKRLLIGGAKGSKVVVTTRTKLVAEITSTISPYVLKGLSKSQSWLLLKQMAFKKVQETIDPNLEAIGKEILENCRGVPLAIKTIGRVLYFKNTKDEWSYIKNNELTNVTQSKNGILPVLKLSYDHLPSHLKCCFSYCSLFPKDYLIDKLTLIQLWIAQGFIQSPQENLQLDVANEYFMDLLWRSFFQEEKEDEGMNRRFKMHDLIHDLAQYVSKTDCTLVDSNAKNVKEKGHHLSFPFYNVSFFAENFSMLAKANKVRTFILAYNKWKYDQGTIEESILKKLISTFKYLRALDLHGLNMKMLPNTIGTLMHLKYLDLSSNNIEVLPSSITKLVNLQTLKLCKCGKLRELPVDIQKLVSLKHLDLEDCEKLTLPCGLGQLTSLQTLNLLVVSKGPVGSSRHCGGLAELNKLNDLRGKLEIKNLAWLKDAIPEFKAANLKDKQRLSELKLRWNPEGDDGVDASDDENSMDSLQPHESLKSLEVVGYMGVRVSSWLSFLTNLIDLSISNCKKCQYLPPLYQLSTLRKLSIWFMDDLEYMTDRDMNDEISASLASPSTFFPSLETLFLWDFPNLKGWWRRDKGNEELESLPEEWFKNLTSLEILVIWECPNLKSLPEGMSHLTSLQRLEIMGCPQLKQRCEKENGEDWDKISHIPNLRIY